MLVCSEDINIEISSDMFRIHPMWNYKFYLFIESGENSDKNTIGIGFKSIKILDDNEKDYISIDSVVNMMKAAVPQDMGEYQVICENGITHDGGIHKFADMIKIGKTDGLSILIMEMESNSGEFEYRLKNIKNTVTSVKRAWKLDNIQPYNLMTRGFDVMSNEVFIQSVKVKSESIKPIKMSDKIAKDKAKLAVSKLF